LSGGFGHIYPEGDLPGRPFNLSSHSDLGSRGRASLRQARLVPSPASQAAQPDDPGADRPVDLNDVLEDKPMKKSSAPRKGITKAFHILATAGFLAGLLSACVAVQPSPEESHLRQEWRDAMAQTPMPKPGCFEATYPSRTNSRASVCSA